MFTKLKFIKYIYMNEYKLHNSAIIGQYVWREEKWSYNPVIMITGLYDHFSKINSNFIIFLNNNQRIPSNK